MKPFSLFVAFPVCIMFMFLFTNLTGSLYSPETTSETKVLQDRCTDWNSAPNHQYLFLKICEYSSGGSGYYQFKNNYDKHMRFSFQLYHANGEVTKGSTNVKSGQTHKASCYNCAEKNGKGTKEFEITNVAFEGEDGYW